MTLHLICKPAKAGNLLLFRYQVQNHGASDVYVMDAMPMTAPDGKTGVNPNAVLVALGEEALAIVGKVLAPMPADRRMAVAAVPLACRIAPGGTLESELKIPLPFAETSPYYADARLRSYEPADITATCFVLGYWEAGAVAAPAAYGSAHFRVAANGGAGLHYVSQRFPTNGLQLLKRTDSFARPAAGWPAIGGAASSRLQ